MLQIRESFKYLIKLARANDFSLIQQISCFEANDFPFGANKNSNKTITKISVRISRWSNLFDTKLIGFFSLFLLLFVFES